MKGKRVTTWKRASFFPFLYFALLQRTLNLMLQSYYFLRENRLKRMKFNPYKQQI